MKKMIRWRRSIAAVLSLCMVLLLLPGTVWTALAIEGEQRNLSVRQISLTVGQSDSVTDTTGNYSDADLSGLDSSVAQVSISGLDGNTAPVETPTDGGSYVLSDGSDHYLKLSQGVLSNTADINEATRWIFTLSSGNNIWKISCDDYYLAWTDGTLQVSQADQNNIWLCSGNMVYVQSGSTGRYTLGYEGDSWTLIKTPYDTDATGDGLAEPYEISAPSTEITFQGVGKGTTSVVIGQTEYQITVNEADTGPLEVELAVTARYTSNRLSWQADGSTEYTVECSQDGAEFTPLDTTAQGSYIHDTGETGTQYYYRVVAGSQTSEPVQANMPTGFEALQAISLASWGFDGEDKHFDGQRRESLAEDGSEAAVALSDLEGGTVIFRTMSGVTSGLTAAVGSDGTFWAGSQNANFRIEVNTTAMKAYLPNVTVHDGTSFHTSAFAFDAGTAHWALSANGSLAGGTLTKGSGFLNSSGATAYYVGGTDNSSAQGFSGQISYVIITGETLTDDELKALTGDNPALGDEDVVLGSDFYQMFQTDNTPGSANCSNTWMFDGGTVTAGHFSDIQGARSYPYQFEEYIRWNQASGSTNWSGRQRYVFNVGKTGQSLADSLAAFDGRAEELDPRAVVYLVGAEDYSRGQAGIAAFQADLSAYIEKGLALRENSGFVLIQNPVPTPGGDPNVELYAQAVEEVLEELSDSQKTRVQLVDHTSATWESSCFNGNGNLNAKGHLELGRQICQRLFGSVSNYPDSNTSADFPNLAVEKAPAVHLAEAASVTSGIDSVTVRIPASAVDVETWICQMELESYTLTVEQKGSEFTLSDLPAGEDYVLTLTASDWSVQLPVMTGRIEEGTAGSVRTQTLDGNQQAIAQLVESDGQLTWLFMGDSITHGALHLAGYDSITQTFEKYLRDDLGREDDLVINTAVSSAGVTDTLTYLYERLERYSPDVVAIMLGTNNRSNPSGANYADNLQAIIDAAQNRGAKVILRIPIPNRDNNDSGLADIRTLALQVAENNPDVIVVDQYAVFQELLTNAGYMGGLLYNDNLHPKAPGQLLMSKLFIEGAGLSLDNTYIGSLSYDLGAARKNGDAPIAVQWGEDGVSLDVDHLSKQAGHSFLKVTLRAEDNTGSVYSVSGGGSGTLTLSQLPEAEYTVTVEAVLGDENTVMTFSVLSPEGISLSEQVRTLVLGDSFTLVAQASGQSVIWNSNNPSVAEVENGRVVAKGSGEAVITATAGEESASCTVTVLESVLKSGYDQGPTGTVADQPLASGTGGSDRFRIPALITLQNGWLMAAADARYTTTSDGGGLDTIVSISKDNGRTWEYSYPIYFPDSDGYVGRAATTIIDPALVQGEDGTVYLIADVNPTGMTTLYATPGKGSGYITVAGVERLALTSVYTNSDTIPTEGDADTYEYYVGDFQDGYAAVMDRKTGAPSGYAVDQWYNLYEVDQSGYTALIQRQVDSSGKPTDQYVQQNVFYKDSALHVFRTGYMWLVSSSDNGMTWSNTDITPQVKRDSETGLLVSPGRGTLLKDGTVVIPFYNHFDTATSAGQERASFIYSQDNGQTWHRTGDVPNNQGFSSESEIVELPDGTLRMFFRNGTSRICYADALWDADAGAYVWNEAVATPVASRSSCNLSAIIYSKEIDGKMAILVACPGNPAGRRDGKVFTFLLNDDNTLTLAYTYAVDSGGPNQYYEYSCLTELKDGSVGLLYEYNAGRINYDAFDITEIAEGAMIDGKRIINVPLYETITRIVQGDFSVTSPEPEGIVSVTTEQMTEMTADRGNDASFSEGTVLLSEALYTFHSNEDGSYVIESDYSPGVYLNHLAGSAGNPGSSTAGNVQLTWNQAGEVGFWMPSGGKYSYLYFHSDPAKLRFDRSGFTDVGIRDNCQFLLYRPAAEGETGSDEIPGYVRISGADGLVDGGTYLIVAHRNGVDYVLYPSNGGGYYDHVAQVGQITTVTRISYTGLREGAASFVETSTGTPYEIRVSAKELQEYSVKVGEQLVLPTEAVPENVTLWPDPQIAELTLGLVDESFTVNGVQGNLAGPDTGSDFNGDPVAMSDALYRFRATGNGDFLVYRETAEGRVYLNIRGGNALIPGSADAATIRFVDQQDGTFRVEETSGTQNGAILYFHDTPVTSGSVTNYLNFNRNGQPAGSNTSFWLFRPAVEGEKGSAELPGYVRITQGDQLEDGGFYLIAAKVDGSFYGLYPSLSADKYDHVVKADANSQRQETVVDNRFQAMTITGVGQGETDAVVNGDIYRIHVTDDSDPEIPVTSVRLDKDSLELTPGQQAQLTATVEPGNATNPTVVWRSSDTGVAAVDEHGVVSAVAPGIAVITASAGGQSAVCQVVVQQQNPPEPEAYLITFDANGGKVETTSMTTGTNGKLASLPTPTREGYTFVGWFTARSGGQQITLNTVFGGNTTVYAQWTPIGGDPSDGGSDGTNPEQPGGNTSGEPSNNNGNQTSGGRTGDNRAVLPAIGLMVIAGIGLALVIRVRRRRP